MTGRRPPELGPSGAAVLAFCTLQDLARKVDTERFLAGVESAKVIGTYVDPALARVAVGE